MESDGRRLRDAPYCRKGTWRCDFYLIEPAPGEEIVIKHRYSAFQGNNLNLLLRSNGIKAVILTGASSNVCVESTARDAYMHDYYQVFVGDCTAAVTREEHEHTLRTIDMLFGQVATSEEITKAWGLSMDASEEAESGSACRPVSG